MQLRKCMDAPVCFPGLLPSLREQTLMRSTFQQKSQAKKKNTVNYHLMRMYPKVVGPRKKEGVLG